MKELSVEEIVKKHIESDLIIQECRETGNSARNNREVKKSLKLVFSYKDDIEKATKVYKTLFKEENPYVLAHAAVECLRIGILIPEAEAILERVSKMEGIGIIRISAEYALRMWRGEDEGTFEKWN